MTLRTVYRDMSALQSAGFPIEGTAGDGYRLSGEAHLRPLALTPEEGEALALAAYGYGVIAAPALREPLTRATTKLEAAMKNEVATRVRALARRIVAPPFARVLAPDAEVLLAVRDCLSATIAFAPPDAPPTKRTIEPLGLVCRGDAWWVVAYCRLRRDARAFRLDHIEHWKTGPAFTPRAGFGFDDVIARDAHLSEKLFGYGAPPKARPARKN